MNAFKYRAAGGFYAGKDNRGNKEPANKTASEDVSNVRQHIESFPTMESHYCRSSTRREYLDSTLSISKMYALYLEERQGKNNLDQGRTRKPVSLITYKRIFCNNYNLSFFRPKKDMCQICENYRTGTIEEKLRLEEIIKSHQRRKEDCNKAKTSDKERASKEPNFLSVTFDLQSVL